MEDYFNYYTWKFKNSSTEGIETVFEGDDDDRLCSIIKMKRTIPTSNLKDYKYPQELLHFVVEGNVPERVEKSIREAVNVINKQLIELSKTKSKVTLASYED